MEFSCRELRSDHFFSSTDGQLRGELVKVHKSAEGCAVKPDIPYHYHTKRHLFIFGLKGRSVYLVNGRKYTVELGTMLYIEPGDAHHTVEIGDHEGEVLEVFYEPPESQTVEVPEEQFSGG